MAERFVLFFILSTCNTVKAHAVESQKPSAEMVRRCCGNTTHQNDVPKKPTAESAHGHQAIEQNDNEEHIQSDVEAARYTNDQELFIIDSLSRVCTHMPNPVLPFLRYRDVTSKQTVTASAGYNV
ncbi:hypothetical protein V8C44DRAFT_331809 [Trichoderma aethiopicum]